MHPGKVEYDNVIDRRDNDQQVSEYDAERNLATILCNADSEMGCGYLKRLGADVNMQAVEQQQAKLQAANKATAAADYAADAKARAEANAKFSAEMQALHSLPGGSDPNSIVDTANQQATNMNALGAANDAALQRTTEQHREQATAPTSSTSASNPSPANVVAERCPSAQRYPDYGASCNPVRVENSCVRVVSNVWDAGANLLTLVLGNTCSSPVRITAWGSSNNLNAAETVNVASGHQYTYSGSQQAWHYQADDGVDCQANVQRSGCSIAELSGH